MTERKKKVKAEKEVLESKIVTTRGKCPTFFECLLREAIKDGYTPQGESYEKMDGRVRSINQVVVKYKEVES